MTALLQHFLATLFTPEGVASLVATVLGIVGGLAWLSARRKKFVALGADIAFHIVEDIAAMTDGADALDKAAVALGKVNEYMVANGWRELNTSEAARVKLDFQAKNGAQIAATKVMGEAMANAAVAAASVALPKQSA